MLQMEDSVQQLTDIVKDMLDMDLSKPLSVQLLYETIESYVKGHER